MERAWSWMRPWEGCAPWYVYYGTASALGLMMAFVVISVLWAK